MEHVRDFNNVSKINVFLISKERPVDAVLNDITDTMMKGDTFDQRGILGEDRVFYQFTFRDKENSHQQRTFYLRDFLFDHNALEEAQDHDSFMRMIDRSRLGRAMRDVLVYDFCLPDTAHQPYELDPIPCFWRRDMLNVSHPDYLKHFPRQNNVVPLFKAA